MRRGAFGALSGEMCSELFTVLRVLEPESRGRRFFWGLLVS